MLQRMVRQISEAGLSSSVTLATNAAQTDTIGRQLGTGVNMVLEPSRRDTFPAIALSCCYLAMEKKCSPDEVVVVMPCDAYTQESYFETIRRMERAQKENAAGIVLMGVSPQGPSSKFGYILPQKERGEENPLFLHVERFVEKPSEDEATRLIAKGALWNGGVFAFRLGYLMGLLERHIHVSSFAELQRRYDELPKISFDYEVVEKTPSVAMVPFSGMWEDLGTWDVLSEKFPSQSIGKVRLSAASENTHAVNELDIPMVCLGTRDLMVAASSEGILVMDKKCASRLKDEVEGLTGRPMYEDRRWGTYQVLHQETLPDGSKALSKRLKILAGKGISYQLHHSRNEIWTIVDGNGLLVLDDVVRKVKRGDVIDIPACHKHCIKALTDVVILELQSGTNLVEEDIERFPWDWTPYAD